MKIVLQSQLVKKLDITIIRKSFDICWIAMIDDEKIHFLGEGQPTKKVRVFLKESVGIIEFERMPKLDDETRDESVFYQLEEVDDLTYKMLEEFELECLF